MIRFLSSMLFGALALLLTAACERGPTVPSSRVYTLERIFSESPPLWEGMTTALAVRALDEQGQPVEGAEVQFSIVRGSGMLAAPSALTDASGQAEVGLTLGPGENEVQATVNGPAGPLRLGVSAAVRPTVAFERDSLALAALGCSDELFARVLDPAGQLMLGHSVQFTATPSDLVSFHVVMVTGSTRGMRARIRGERAGTTEIIAKHESGAADTVRVRVLRGDPARVRVSIMDPSHPMSVYFLAVGDTVQARARVETQCGGELSDLTADLTNLNPGTATLDASGRLFARSAGTVNLVGRAGTLADTARLDIRHYRLLPADTTVFVGDTVVFRASVADTSGVFMPWNANFSSSDSTVARLTSAPGRNAEAVVVAQSVGTAKVKAEVFARQTATLRIIARP